MTAAPLKHLRVAVTTFPLGLPLDFIGPLDVFNRLAPNRPDASRRDYAIESIILGETLDPVTLSGGMQIIPQMTYNRALEQGQKWDAVLVPGGPGSRPNIDTNRPAKEFLKAIVPSCTYVLTVCTGSWLLAQTGLLSGQKATTNKAAFKECVEATKDQGITWVPKARYVVSHQFWTSSGVTAGIDMASVFIRYFIGLHVPADHVKAVADHILGGLEVIENGEADDPWADYYGL